MPDMSTQITTVLMIFSFMLFQAFFLFQIMILSFGPGIAYIHNGVLSSHVRKVVPGEKDALQKPSQVMIDKIMTVKHDKLGLVFGRIDEDTLLEIERCLAVFLGIAK